METLMGLCYITSFIVLVILLIYLLRRRIKDKKLENFEQKKIGI